MYIFGSRNQLSIEKHAAGMFYYCIDSTFFSLATVKFIRVVVVLRLLSKKDKSPVFGPKITIAQS